MLYLTRHLSLSLKHTHIKVTAFAVVAIVYKPFRLPLPSTTTTSSSSSCTNRHSRSSFHNHGRLFRVHVRHNAVHIRTVPGGYVHVSSSWPLPSSWPVRGMYVSGPILTTSLDDEMMTFCTYDSDRSRMRSTGWDRVHDFVLLRGDSRCHHQSSCRS